MHCEVYEVVDTGLEEGLQLGRGHGVDDDGAGILARRESTWVLPSSYWARGGDGILEVHMICGIESLGCVLSRLKPTGSSIAVLASAVWPLFSGQIC